MEVLFCRAKGPGPLSLITGLVTRIWCFQRHNPVQLWQGTQALLQAFADRGHWRSLEGEAWHTVQGDTWEESPGTGSSKQGGRQGGVGTCRKYLDWGSGWSYRNKRGSSLVHLNITRLHSGFPGGSDGKESTCNAEDLGSIPGKDPLEKRMAAHSCFLAWEIPWIEEPCGLWSMGSHRVGHD